MANENTNLTTDFTAIEPIVKTDIMAGLVPMLLGEPGIGKSSFLIDIAERELRTKIFILACNQLADRADLTGSRLIPTGNGDNYKQEFFPHATIMAAIEYAETHPDETPILFLDECNRTTSDITTAIMHMVTGREIGTTKLPENLRLVSAGNDKGNIVTLDDATLSRFSIYRVEPDVATFLAVNPTLYPAIKTVLQKKPTLLFCRPSDTIVSDDNEEETIYNSLYDDEEFKQFTTPRTITYLSNFLNAVDDINMMIQTGSLFTAIVAKVGETEFASEVYNEIINAVSSGTAESGCIKVVKPKTFDSFVACKDRASAVDFATSMNQADQSGSLIYMLTQRQDYSQYIDALVNANPNMAITQMDMQALMQASMSGGLSKKNTEAFLNTNSPVSNKLSAVLEFSA